MPEITEGVYHIPGQDEFMPDAHTYVLGKPSSQNLSLVDAGLTGKGTYKIQAIKKAGIELSSIKRVIMTHTHLDHIGCFAEILKQLPWAELWVHRSEADLLEKGDERAVYGMDMFREYCQGQLNLKPGALSVKFIANCKEAKPWISAAWPGRSFTSRVTPWAASAFITAPRKSLFRGMSSIPIMRLAVLTSMEPTRLALKNL